MKVRKIIIVGGGSSGWITASVLSKNKCNFDITLVESNKIPTMAVGESTQQEITQLLDLLEIEDKEWMPKCEATYKNSIRFRDFSVKGESFQYPFGEFDWAFSPHKVMTWFGLSVTDRNFTSDTFARFINSNAYLADYNKQTYESNDLLLGFDFRKSIAYHMNASLFGGVLKELVALKNGVKHIVGTVQDVVFSEDGKVEKLLLDNDRELEGDLYIDCSGFSSILLEKKMKAQHINFNLPNDSAVKSPIPYTNRNTQLTNTTDCTALSSGWCWNTPLWERMGSGYVYSSEFITKEKAEEEFVEYVKSRGESTQDLCLEHIPMRTGKKDKAWIKNVIGIGLSYSFIEPLESTGLWSTHKYVMNLLEVLEKRNGFVSKIDVDGFNFFCDFETEHFKTFIIEHYILSQREDTPYWNYVTNEMGGGVDILDNILKVSRHYEEWINTIYSHHQVDESHRGALYIAAGMGYRPASKRKIMEFLEKGQLSHFNETKKTFWDHESKVRKYLRKLPSSVDFLKTFIYN